MTWSNGMGHILVQMHMQAGLNLTGELSTKKVDKNNKRLAFSRSVWIVSDWSFEGKGKCPAIGYVSRASLNTSSKLARKGC